VHGTKILIGLVWLSLASAKPFQTPSADAIESSMEQSRDKPIPERLVQVTDSLVGAPYVISPLGEGQAHREDSDPRIRLDAFDCTTFVETGIAFSMADNFSEAKSLLDVIRYKDGNAHFLGRRHFPESEWIPELIAMGFLKDVTRAVAKDETRVESKKLNVALWEARRKKILSELPLQRIPQGEFTLDVWPLKKARKNYKRIPSGTVLNLVRINRKSVPVRVTHQGLVVEIAGKLYMRHAADRMYHSVVDEPLDAFLSRMLAYRKWPVAGIHLLSVQEPPEWRKKFLTAPRYMAWPHRPAYHP
jgi:hypothetical protein